MKKKGLIRKIAAAAALALVLSEMPALPVKAAPGDPEDSSTSTEMTTDENGNQVTTQAPTAASTTEEKYYSVTTDQTKPGYTAFKGITELRDRSSYRAPENTYSLTVSTGAKPGDTVLYFDVQYRDSSGRLHSQYIFPGVDAITRSDKLLKYSAGDAIYNSFGRKLAGELNYNDDPAADIPLAAWSTQDFTFQTETAIASIEQVSIFLSSGGWNVQGLSIYSVSEYKGYEEYGLISGQQFLDFKGELIASFQKNRSSLTISTSGASSVVMLCSATAGKSMYGNVINYDATERPKKEFAASADANAIYSIRVDIADQVGAGLESLINESAEKLSAFNGVIEDVAIEIQYKDSNNWTRKVTLPLVLSAYGMLRRCEPNSTIMGIAQRGDTVAFQGLFPDFKTLLDATVVYVGPAARKQIAEHGLTEKNVGSQANRLGASASDDISFGGISIYKGGCMPYIPGGTDSDGNMLEGATPDIIFESAVPNMYYTTSEERGRVIRAGSSDKIRMITYTAGAPLVATNNSRSKFMVTLYTSSIQGGGTKDDISMRFKYETVRNADNRTDYYYVKDAANEFLGTWPTTSGGNFLDEGGTNEGGKVSFLIDAADVKNFTDVEIMIMGQDEWQMKNLTIAYVQNTGKRRAFLHDTVNGNATSKYYLMRDMISAEIFNLAGTANTFVTDENGNRLDKDGNMTTRVREQVFDSNGNPVYDDDGNPAYVYLDSDESGIRGLGDEQFFMGDSTYKISFNTRTVEDVRDLDYADVRYKMTFDQAHVNWNFFKKKKTYDITVKVADDPDFDNGNGDSGSTNHFFFQLTFANGNSGYVLANQQLTSDGFRSGKAEVFSISTNQNYGELRGMRIIPEQVSSESDPFDKLNIEKITVTEQNNGGACMRYVFDGVGWISIDYHDELEATSPKGQRAKTEYELAKYIEYDYKDRAVNLLMEVTTEPVFNDYLAFEGAVMGEITYISSSSQQLETMSFDVISRMAAYMNKTPRSYDASKNNNVPNNVGTNSISDPEWMIRANHKDRFVIPAVADLKELKSVKFTMQPLNGHPATWNIGDINVSQVLDDGQVKLSANGEYIRAMKTKKLCSKKEKEVTPITAQAGMTASTPDIEFTTNEIVWSSDDHWATPVSRIPDTTNDTVNIYVFPDSASRKIDGVKLSASMQYGVPYTGYDAASWDTLNTAFSGTDRAVFYITGLNAKGFNSAGDLWLQCADSGIAIDYALVQQVRDGVVVGNYTYYFGDASVTLGISAHPLASSIKEDYCEEHLNISFGTGTETRSLIKQELDIAVAFTYTSTLDDSGMEYTSPYVYLTDMGIKQISEGLFADIKYNVSFVREITGYRIAAYGGLTGSVEAACGTVYQVDDLKLDVLSGEYYNTAISRRSYASFIGSFALSDKLTRHLASSKLMSMEGGVVPVTLTFNSNGDQPVATADVDGNSGDIVISRETSDAIQSAVPDMKIMMIFHYRNNLGIMATRTYSDITKYIQSENKSFSSGEPVVIQFFIPEMAKFVREVAGDPDLSYEFPLVSVEIYPYTGSAENAIPENPATLVGSAATIDPNMSYDPTQMNQQNLSIPNNVIPVKNVTVDLGNGMRKLPTKEVNTYYTGRQGSNLLRFADVLLTTHYSLNDGASTEVSDHLAYVLAKSNDVIRGTVDVGASLSGYNIKAFRMVGEAGEDITATAITSADVKNFTFVAPENDTDGTLTYKITISPVDAPTVVDIIMVTVEKNQKTEDPATTDPNAPSTDTSSQQPSSETTQPSSDTSTQQPSSDTTQPASDTASEAPVVTPPPSEENTENSVQEPSSADTQ